MGIESGHSTCSTRPSGLYSNNNLELLKDYLFRKHGCLPFRKSFRKTWLGSKRNTTSWVVPGENFGGQPKIWKGRPVFPDGINAPNNPCSISSAKPSLITVSGFRGRFLVKFGTILMVDTIPGRESRILLRYLLQNPWTNRFAFVNIKRPFFMYLLFKTFGHKIVKPRIGTVFRKVGEKME